MILQVRYLHKVFLPLLLNVSLGAFNKINLFTGCGIGWFLMCRCWVGGPSAGGCVYPSPLWTSCVVPAASSTSVQYHSTDTGPSVRIHFYPFIYYPPFNITIYGERYYRLYHFKILFTPNLSDG